MSVKESLRKPKLMKDDIKLSWEERQKLKACPNCKTEQFLLKLIQQEEWKNHPVNAFRLGRPVYECQNCGYWTDYFDGWVWHPPIEKVM